MIKAVLNSINGVELYPVLSLGLFMTFFIGMLIWVVRLDKGHITDMLKMPLESDTVKKGDTSHGAL